MLAHWSSSPVETELLKQVIASFEKQVPGHQRAPPGARSVPGLRCSRSSRPASRRTCSTSTRTSLPDWAKQGVLEPLDAWIDAVQVPHEAVLPAAPERVHSPTGKTYGFPKDWSPLGMQTNTAMLGEGRRPAPTTWTTLRSAAQRLQSTGAVPGGRPICLAPGWDRGCSRSSTRTDGAFISAARRAIVATPAATPGDRLLRRADPERARRHARRSSGSAGAARRSARRRPRSSSRATGSLPFMAEQFPTVRYANNPMVREQGRRATSRSRSRTRSRRTPRTSPPRGRC